MTMKQLDLYSLASPPRSPSDRNPDVGLILISGAIGAATLASIWPKHQPGLGLLAAIGGTIACLSLAVRRSRPAAVAAFTTSVAIFSPMAIPATILAVVNVAVSCRIRTYLMLAAYVAGVAIAHLALYYSHVGFLSDQLPAAVALLPTIALGPVARARRSRAESEHQALVEQARAAERRRIAREMHDVLAHRISMLSVHAGALEVHPDAPREDIASSAGVIRSSAHAALDELRGIISVLRNGADHPDDESALLQRPQPTLHDVQRLIEESERAGMRVHYSQALDRTHAVPETTGRAVYRIVQEGLTNVRKHAPASAVEVQIKDDGACALTVSVVNGPPADEPTRGSPRDESGPSPTSSAPGSGTGLIGLAERVALAGGQLAHGQTSDGGYFLVAALPVPR